MSTMSSSSSSSSGGGGTAASYPCFDMQSFVSTELPEMRNAAEASAIILAALLGEKLCLALRALLASSQRDLLLQALLAALETAAAGRTLPREVAALGPITTSLIKSCDKQRKVLLSSVASLLQKIQSSSKVLAQYSDQNYATAAELEATGLVGALAAQKRSVALFESVLCGRLRLLLSLAASPSLTAEHVALLDTAAADLGLGRPPGVEAQTAAQAAAGEEEGECSREHQLQSVSDTLVLYQKSPAQSNTSSAYADSSSILSSINALPSSAEAAGPANKRLRSSEEDDNDRKQPIVHISSPIEQRLSCEGAASPASSKASSRGGHASSQTESCPDAENVRPLTMYTPDNMLSTPAAASGSQQSPNLSSQEITI